MKIYISAKFERNAEVKEIGEQFTDLGHIMLNNWIHVKQIKPFLENKKLAEEYAMNDISKMLECDVFILLCGETKGAAMYVELGAAISSAILTGKPMIYVVGNTNDRCLFYFHPTVRRKETIADVTAEIEKIKNLSEVT